MFIHDNFMLSNDFAVALYNDFAKDCPIIDFHNHLDASAIAQNRQPRSITELWLGGDHYKWRALRANGVPEKYITGDASDWEKFEKWAQTLPHTMRNPLYHWTQLELKRYFGINEILTPCNARKIYDECNRQIAEGGFGAADLLKKMNVEVVCTTDDPVDSLEFHGTHNGIKVLPSWRPDKVLAVENHITFNAYIDRLGSHVDSLGELFKELRNRQKHFISKGCRVSDHGLDTFYGDDFTDEKANEIFKKIRRGEDLSDVEIRLYKSAVLHELCVMNNEAGWVQQFHVGPLRNNCSRLFDTIGPDVGCDSLGDLPIAQSMAKVIDKLDKKNQLAKTIVYNLNPKDSEVIAAMIYNFNDGSCAGKLQYGAAWWFLDQADGIKKQIETLSSFGLLSHFVGMLTDSRSFLSFTRHEYFRRILCNILGKDIKKGLLPESEYAFIGDMVHRICYDNSKQYFGF